MLSIAYTTMVTFDQQTRPLFKFPKIHLLHRKNEFSGNHANHKFEK